MINANKKQIEAGINMIISAQYLEESAREFRSTVFIKPKIDMLDGRAQRFSGSEVIKKDCEKVIEAAKVLNSHINQLMIKKNKAESIADMSFSLAEIFRECSLMSIPKQQKVMEFIKELKSEK